MDFFSLNLKDKVLFSLIVILTLFLAYSESFKNLSAYLLIGFFLWSVITSKIKITKDLVNISIISHLLIVLCGVVFGINTNESLDQSKDVIRIIILFLFFREANLHFLTYERILNLLFLGFVLTALASIYYFIYNFTPTIYNRIELNSVGSINRSAVYITYIFIAYS